MVNRLKSYIVWSMVAMYMVTVVHAGIVGVTFKVKGMTCEVCATGLKNKLSALEVVDKITSVNFNDGTVVLMLIAENQETDESLEKILRTTTKNAGFTFDKMISTE